MGDHWLLMYHACFAPTEQCYMKLCSYQAFVPTGQYVLFKNDCRYISFPRPGCVYIRL